MNLYLRVQFSQTVHCHKRKELRLSSVECKRVKYPKAAISAVVSAYCHFLVFESAKMMTMRQLYDVCSYVTSLTGKRFYAVLLVISLPRLFKYRNFFSVSLPFVTHCFLKENKALLLNHFICCYFSGSYHIKCFIIDC